MQKFASQSGTTRNEQTNSGMIVLVVVILKTDVGRYLETQFRESEESTDSSWASLTLRTGFNTKIHFLSLLLVLYHYHPSYLSSIFLGLLITSLSIFSSVITSSTSGTKHSIVDSITENISVYVIKIHVLVLHSLVRKHFSVFLFLLPDEKCSEVQVVDDQVDVNHVNVES